MFSFIATKTLQKQKPASSISNQGTCVLEHLQCKAPHTASTPLQAESHQDTVPRPGLQAVTTLQSCGALHKRLPHTEQQGKAPYTMNQHAGSFGNVEQQMHPVMEGATPSMLVRRGQVGASSTWNA